MSFIQNRRSILLIFLSLLAAVAFAEPGGLGTSGTLVITVTDTTGAVIPGVTVEASNPVSGLRRSAVTDPNGQITLTNIPFTHVHLSAVARGFQSATQDADVRSTVPMNIVFALNVANAAETVTVEADQEDVMKNTSVASTDIDRELIQRLPTESVNSPLSSLVTLSTPGVAADSNGLFHPLGEHADTTFSVDGQPISDQQSRVFSNQLPISAVQSIQVINGAIPPEFGDKASLVVQTTTRSGLDNPRPHGSLGAGYGSFGTSDGNAALAFGGKTVGNFISVDVTNSGRYLDSPELRPLHDHGNSESLFDRVDFQPSQKDTIHINLLASRSWFQQPNQYDQQAKRQDQRARIMSYDLSPFWTHLFNERLVLSVNPYLRQDQFHYYPSADPFRDTPASLAQSRRLQNAGFKTDLSYSKGVHNLKAGVNLYHTFLHEGFSLGITDPAFNAICLDGNGKPILDPSVVDPACGGANQQPNPNFQPGLLNFDLSRGGMPFRFNGRTDIKQVALFLQDNISWRNWTFMVGARQDVYRGLSHRDMFQPRVGGSYNIKRTNTVLRAAYSRVMLTPYNENLIVSSATGAGGLSTNLGAFGQHPLAPAARNQYNAGVEQSFGKHVVIDADYSWKYTSPDFDFDVVLNTPLTFPIQWEKSKIDGAAVRVSLLAFHVVSAYTVLGHTRSRFFTPEVGGILFNDPATLTVPVFRIDHDQALEQTTHLQYQPRATFPWFAFNWRYDSGLVAGKAPFATDSTTPVDLTGLSADQQAQMGLICGGVRATLSSSFDSCAPAALSSSLVRIPAPGTENADKNPPRIKPRSVFDVSVGWDNIFHRDHIKTAANLSVLNVTNVSALYNFLSTFSGTHFLPPRTFQAGTTITF